MNFFKKTDKDIEKIVEKRVASAIKKEKESCKLDLINLENKFNKEKAAYQKEVSDLVRFKLTEVEALRIKLEKEYAAANKEKNAYHEAEKILNKYIIIARRKIVDSKRLQELIKDIQLDEVDWSDFLTKVESETLRGFKIFDKELQDIIKVEAKKIEK